MEMLRARLAEHPELIDALGGLGFQKATALHLAALRRQHSAARMLIEQGANLDARDFPDNAAPLHFAAMNGDLEMARLLVDAGADVNGSGDDYGVGVIGWATCFRHLARGCCCLPPRSRSSAQCLVGDSADRPDDVRTMITGDPSLLNARMTDNSHRRTPLHHAAAKNRLRSVRLLLELGADPNAIDATGATALTTASQEGADQAVASALQQLARRSTS